MGWRWDTGTEGEERKGSASPRTELKQGMGRRCPVSSHNDLFSDRRPHPAVLRSTTTKVILYFPHWNNSPARAVTEPLDCQILCRIIGIQSIGEWTVYASDGGGKG